MRSNGIPATMSWISSGLIFIRRRGSAAHFFPCFDNIRQLYGGRKPVALCETGSLADPDDWARDGADWLWFLIWDDFITRPDANPVSLINRTYRNGHVVRLDTLER